MKEPKSKRNREVIMKKTSIYVLTILLLGNVQSVSANEANPTVESNQTEQQQVPANQPRANIATGVFGTSSWNIDTAGVLHIGAGEFKKSENRSPWYQYSKQITSISFDGPVKAHSNSSQLFENLDKVTAINNLNQLDTSNATSIRGMFSNTTSLTSLDLSHFNTSRVTDMAFIFNGMKSLVQLDVSSFDTSNVIYMRSMFYGTSSLTSLDLSNFNTSKAEDMSGLFMESNLSHLNISSFNTSSATDMSGMFSGNNLSSIDVSKFDTSKVTNMGAMFSRSKLTQLDVSNFNTSQVRRMSEMFSDSQISHLDLSSFDTSQVTSMDSMFSGSRIEQLDVSNFDTSTVNYMYDMFTNMNALKQVHLGQQFQFKDAVLPTPSSTLPYYGKWQRNHEGAVYTPAELAQQYDGLTMSGIYNWAEKLPTIEVKDSVLYAGEAWDAKDNFISATDPDGNVIPFVSNMTSDTVNTAVPGDYKVTYTNGSISKVATVTVLENQQSLHVNDTTLYVGESWKAEDAFVSATDKTGNEVPFTESMVSGTVDTEKQGEYQVTYTNGPLVKTVVVTVKENQESLEVQGRTIYVGDDWQAEDSFILATDRDGNRLTFDDKMVNGTVDTKTPGTYSVVYTNGTLSKNVTVTVKENQAGIDVKDATIAVGDNWQAEDNFVSATDKAGNDVAFEEIEVTGEVNPSKAGRYDITYAYEGLNKTAVVTVKNAVVSVNDGNSNDQPKEKPSNIVGDKPVNTEKKDAPSLPQTGEQFSEVVVIAGLILVALSFNLLKRKHFIN